MMPINHFDNQHLNIHQVNLFLDKSLDQSEFEIIRDHLEICSQCTEAVSELESLFGILNSLKDVKLEHNLVPIILEKINNKFRISDSLKWGTVLQVLVAITGLSLLSPKYINLSWFEGVKTGPSQLFNIFQNGVLSLLSELSSELTSILNTFNLSYWINLAIEPLRIAPLVFLAVFISFLVNLIVLGKLNYEIVLNDMQ